MGLIMETKKPVTSEGFIRATVGIGETKRGSGVAKVLLDVKRARRRPVKALPVEETVIVAIDPEDIARIGEVCARGATMTEHVIAALAAPWRDGVS